MTKNKIFVSAFSCMPHSGSEPGVGWHWIIEMSRYYELWVMVHKEKKDDIEVYVKENGTDKEIHFIYYDIPFNSLFFKGGEFRWVRIYYQLWIIFSNKIVRKTMVENDIHVFHNLTFGNAIWPISKFGQKQTFIWGPVGGVETIPYEFLRHYNLRDQLFELVRKVMVKSLRFNLGFNKRCQHAKLILCKTEAMRKSIPIQYRHKAVLFTDVAVENREITGIEHKEDSCIVNILSVGRLDAWRGFDILIEAFAIAIKHYPDMHLTILGGGRNSRWLKRVVKKRKLEQYCTMPGSVNIDAYNKTVAQTDIIVNSCLKEGAVTVSFDSMHYSKPLICIDSGGFTRYFSSDYAIVLTLEDRNRLIKKMSDAIVRLASNTNMRKEMGEKAHLAGRLFDWSTKGKEIKDCFNRYIGI